MNKRISVDILLTQTCVWSVSLIIIQILGSVTLNPSYDYIRGI